MSEKEFKVQKALGLADQFKLKICVRTNQEVNFEILKKAVEKAVEKHTFQWEYIEGVCYFQMPYPGISCELSYGVKCIPNIMGYLSKELQHLGRITMTLSFYRHGDFNITQQYQQWADY